MMSTPQKSRSSLVIRETKESKVSVDLNLDGSGIIDIDTGVPFFDHMMSQLGKHAGFDFSRKECDLSFDEKQGRKHAKHRHIR